MDDNDPSHDMSHKLSKSHQGFFPQLNRTYDSSSDDFSSVLRAILCFYTRRALRALLSNAACKHERTPTYQPMRK